MDKPVRKAVRCFLIKDNKVMSIKYLQGKVGYYDIPGGGIEEGEAQLDAVKREFKEETGLEIINPIYRGTMYLDTPKRKYVLGLYIANEYKGEPQDFPENTAQWKDINELLNEEKKFPNIILLERFFRKILVEEKELFDIKIISDDNEKILEMEFKYI